MLSGLDPNTMQILAKTALQQLLYDFGETQDYYKVTLGPPKVLQRISPKDASAFLATPGITIIYNPFGFNPYQKPLSGLV